MMSKDYLEQWADWVVQVAKAGMEAAIAEIDRQGVTGQRRQDAIQAAVQLVKVNISSTVYKSRLAEAKAREEARREKKKELGNWGNQRKQEKNARRDQRIRDDHARFVRAFRSYERMDLLPLLKEFNVEEKRRATFKPNNVARALAESGRYKRITTAAQVRNILRTKKR